MVDLAVPRLTRATRDWFVNSPLGPSADGYVQYLQSRGYAAASIRSYIVSVAHFSHWLAGRHYGLSDLNETFVSRFLDRHLPTCRCAPRLPHLRYCVRPALLHLLVMLRAEQKIAPKVSTDPATIATELREFERHMIDVRGLSPTTRYVRLVRVRAFLLDLFGARPIRLNKLSRTDIVGFIARHTAQWKPSSKQCLASALQSYFRFKVISGEQTTALSAAIPRIAQWRLATLPKSLSPAELARLMQAFDRTCATGMRDYAITRCFVDLGLRAAEVARLRLDDVDWQSGTLRIRGKGRRVDTLPIPTMTGRAIVAYLSTGRPDSDDRALFLRHGPPVGRPATARIVRNAVCYAAVRCGLEGRVTGPHTWTQRRPLDGGLPKCDGREPQAMINLPPTRNDAVGK